MLVIKSFVATAIAALTTVAVAASTTTADLKVVQNGTTKASHGHGKITPKVMIVSMFTPERRVWIKPMGLVHNYTTPGLSPLFEEIACDKAQEVCIVTTGEAEINAAATMTALVLSPHFDLTKTYFLIAGIGGVNPYHGTLGTAAFSRFAIQVGLEYELDARQIPGNWSTGYWALGTDAPGQLPAVTDLYGSELFELNTNLLNVAYNVTRHLTLNDSATAQAYRAKFDYAPADQAPTVIKGDSLCSDVYFAGTLLAESFGNLTELVTGGQGTYVMTAQEDNATLEALVRATKARLVDYSRVILLRTASDFDRAPPGNVTALAAFQAEQGGFGPAIENIVVVGKPLVEHIITEWNSTFHAGIKPQSIGNGSHYGDNLGTIRKGPALARKRSLRARASLGSVSLRK